MNFFALLSLSHAEGRPSCFTTKHFDVRFSKPPSDRDDAQNREAKVSSKYKGKGMQQYQRRAMVPSMHLSILFLFFLRITSGLDVSIPTSPFPRAPKISPSFVSFSIEQDRWTDWVGLTSRNQFFINTLENLRYLTGVPPQIRIGANSEDHTNFNPCAKVTPPCLFIISSDRENHRRLPNLSFLHRLRRHPIRKRRTSPLATRSMHLLGSSQIVGVPRQPPSIY
jgi:hypothetical protein